MIEPFKGTNLIDFMDRFPNDEKCKEYLVYYKWNDGFQCSKCGHSKYWNKNSDPFIKVCKGCRHIESVTANTLFHKMKFGLRKAFLILFEMASTTKSCSALTMARKYGINPKTSWLFMHKVRKAMSSSCQYPLTDVCEVDEVLIGGKVSGKRGRGALKKKKVCVVIKKTKAHGISRAYAMKIPDFSTIELRKIFDRHINTNAKIVDTDKWKGYSPLAKEWNIKQIKSQLGTNFNLMHRFIQQMKGWLRGIHHHASEQHLQGYLDEYCFRFNRHGHKGAIFDKLVSRMASHSPINYKLLIY